MFPHLTVHIKTDTKKDFDKTFISINILPLLFLVHVDQIMKVCQEIQNCQKLLEFWLQFYIEHFYYSSFRKLYGYCYDDSFGLMHNQTNAGQNRIEHDQTGHKIGYQTHSKVVFDFIVPQGLQL